jgi:hypothetical protein
VIGALAVAAAAVGGLGGAMLVLAEGRRALATGLLLVAAGLVAELNGLPAGQAAVGVAGLGAAALRLRSGRPGWDMIPPGSTPRVLLTFVTAIVGAFVAGSMLQRPGTIPMRAALVVIGTLAAARLLSTQRRDAALAAGAALCLVLAALAAASAVTAFPLGVVLAAGAALLIAGLPGEALGT